MNCSQCRHRRHDWIVAPNEANSDVFFIDSGCVRLQFAKVAGREVVFEDVDAGDYFGGESAILGSPRMAGALALTDVAVTRMPVSVFRELLHAHADVCDQFLYRLAGQIQVLANRVNELSTLDVRHRIYAELLRLSRPTAEAHRAVISPPPLQTDIAARIGARREAVAREMKALERIGLLLRRRGAVDIADTRCLQDLLERDLQREEIDHKRSGWRPGWMTGRWSSR